MKFRNTLALVALTVPAFVACGSSSDSPPSEQVPEPVSTTTETARDIEAAQRSLDVGKVPPGAIAKFMAVANDKSAPNSERDEAAIAVSRAQELDGKREDAIETLENLLARHREDDRWSRDDEVSGKLFELVTGNPQPERPESFERDPIASVARALAPSFTPDAKGNYDLNILVFGGVGSVSNALGTFNVGDAIRDQLMEKCPLCEKRPNIHTHQGRMRSWTMIPKYRDDFANSMLVFYYDASSGKVPARYDSDLPLPTADIDARIADGKGLIAVKRRGSAPPVLLLAAPRFGLLAQVEEHLAGLSELPEEPISVELRTNITRDEITQSVRSARHQYKSCYETLLQSDAKAAGKLSLEFTIDPDGQLRNLEVTPNTTPLGVPSFVACVTTATQTLKFPKTGNKTSVVYPLTLSP